MQWNQDMSDKRMPGETQELWGEVRGWNTMRGAAWWQAWKSLDKYFCQGKLTLSTVHYIYSEKEGLCGVETYLIGTGLKTKGFGVYCARLESPNTSINISFHSEGLKPTDVVVLISHLQALIPDLYWLINHPSLCYVIAMRTEMWY